MAVYMVTAVALGKQFGLFSLMIADSLKHITHATISAYLLHRRLRGLGGQRLVLTLGKTLLAAATMGGVVLVTEPVFKSIIGKSGLLQEIVLVTMSGSLAILVFGLVAIFFNIEELRWLMMLVRRKFSR
jgi:putative peptidoglycan lipid II flippase